MEQTPATQNEPIVVTGVGLVSPLGIGTQNHWQRGLAGESAVAPRRNTSEDATQHFLSAEVQPFKAKNHLPRKKLRGLPRAVLFARIATLQALTEAGLEVAALDPTRVAVFLGSNHAGIDLMLDIDQHAADGFLDPILFPNSGVFAPACNVSVSESFSSMTHTTSSGHSSGLEAIRQAQLALQNGRADIAVAGGVEELCTRLYDAAAFQGAVCAAPAEGSRAWLGPFQPEGKSTVPGEGGACLVLERRAHALQRGATILAELSGWSSGFDPKGCLGDTPDVAARKRIIVEALNGDANQDAPVQAVISCASGFHHHDHAEADALNQVFEHQPIPVATPASQIGDLNGAASAFAAATAVLAMRDSRLPGHAVSTANASHCDLDWVQAPRDLAIDSCLVTAFGTAGDLAALRLSKP